MIKYKSAYNSLGKVVSIKDIEKVNNVKKEIYTCISCEKELIPKIGKINQHHFAHKEILTCNPETYLHKLGKILFYQEYKDCLIENKPFIIELYHDRICNKCEPDFNKVCKLEKILQKHDLTLHFDKIALEKKEAGFIPDVTLSSKNGEEKIFIEIVVTHFSTEQKLLSNNRIIEFEVQDETDLDTIRQHHISVDHYNVTFENFKAKELRGSIYAGNCDKTFDFFVVLSDGQGKLFQKSLSQIRLYLNQERAKILYHALAVNDNDQHIKYKYFVAKAQIENVKIKNCIICKSCATDKFGIQTIGSNKEYKPIFCWHLRDKHNSNSAAKCNSNEAVKCEAFKPDKNHIDKLLVLGNYIKTYSL